MECPHIDKDGVKIDLKNLKNSVKAFQCSQCDAKDSVWICATCGVLNCGRYIKGHGLDHYKSSGHSVCMDCNELSVFCYACDDFIINDTSDSKLDNLRSVLIQIREKSTPSSSSLTNDKEPSKSTPKDGQSGRRKSLRPRNRRRSLDSINGGVENSRPPANKKARKSTGSTNSNSSKSLPPTPPNNSRKGALKSLVGLRNLGNTCFMSAVLQSLGNINEFCHVLKQLPPFDGEHLSSSSTKATSTPKNSVNGNGNQSIAKSKELPDIFVI